MAGNKDNNPVDMQEQITVLGKTLARSSSKPIVFNERQTHALIDQLPTQQPIGTQTALAFNVSKPRDVVPITALLSALHPKALLHPLHYDGVDDTQNHLNDKQVRLSELMNTRRELEHLSSYFDDVSWHITRFTDSDDGDIDELSHLEFNATVINDFMTNTLGELCIGQVPSIQKRLHGLGHHPMLMNADIPAPIPVSPDMPLDQFRQTLIDHKDHFSSFINKLKDIHRSIQSDIETHYSKSDIQALLDAEDSRMLMVAPYKSNGGDGDDTSIVISRKGEDGSVSQQGVSIAELNDMVRGKGSEPWPTQGAMVKLYVAPELAKKISTMKPHHSNAAFRAIESETLTDQDVQQRFEAINSRSAA